MALGARLELRQGQGLVITPQLQQAIKLLQLSNLELSAFIEGELEQNPLLERDETPAEGASEPAPPAEEEAGDEVTLWQEASGAEGEGNLDLAGDPAAWQSRTTRDGGGRALPGIDQTLTRPETLHDHLLAQLSLDIHDPVDRIIGTHLVDMVDEGGELDVGELQQLDRLLQLRRHDERLGLPEIEPLRERHDDAYNPKPVMAANIGPTD